MRKNVMRKNVFPTDKKRPTDKKFDIKSVGPAMAGSSVSPRACLKSSHCEAFFAEAISSKQGLAS
jgi:hypothetical protein